MATEIYVNLPVKDLERSKAFFSALGYRFNPQFTNEQAAAMIISDGIYVMLLVESFFQNFIPNAICDTRKHTEVAICLSSESRQAVDALVKKAVAAGAAPSQPRDHGFMYQHGFQDLDGHVWEVVHMDMNALPASMKAGA